MTAHPFIFPLALLAMNALAGEPPDGHAVIRARAGASEIVITTTPRLAGAIDSLTWNGREFINSHDHGRQLQSASNLDCGTPIANETYNPTEAGSRNDAAGPRSSSELQFLRAGPSSLETRSRMAFWLAPGQKSGPNLAKNTTILSNHLLTKRLSIGYHDLPHVIPYEVTFSLPVGELHHHAVFEALTGYMPPEFSMFQQFNPKSGELEPLSVGPGEIPQPIIFSVPAGTHAMGIYAPPQPTKNMTGPTFGRFIFPAAKVVKWNCVFRLTDPAGIRPADYSFRMFVLVGDLQTVRGSMRSLVREFSGPH